MDNYQFFNNEKIKYLSYLIEQIKLCQVKFNNFLKERDVKLKLVLNSDLSDIVEEANAEIDRIKSKINNINILNPQSISKDKLEEIAIDVTNIVNYIEYFFDKFSPNPKIKLEESDFTKGGAEIKIS